MVAVEDECAPWSEVHASAFRNFKKTKQRAYYKEQRRPTSRGGNPTPDSDSLESEDDNDVEDPDLGGSVNIDLYDLSEDTDEFPDGCDPSEMVEVIEKIVSSLDL